MPKLSREEFYPVVDRVPHDQCRSLGIKVGQNFPVTSLGIPVKGISAKWTGERRPPRKGEWYLSGAIIEAYRAPNDLSSEYYIAKLVRTETKTVTITREV